MKKFIISVLCVAVFFIGLGGLIEKTAASLKSDDRAVEVIRRARIAIGGEAAVANVRSMTITGRATKTFDLDGVSRTLRLSSPRGFLGRLLHETRQLRRDMGFLHQQTGAQRREVLGVLELELRDLECGIA